jgi:hypothetical protein
MKNLNLFAASLILLASSVAGAQNSESNATGVNPIGSIFTPSPGTVPAPATPAIQAAIATATATVNAQLTSGSLTSVTGATIPAAVVSQVGSVLTSTSSVNPSGGAASPAATALASSIGTSGAPASVVASLIESLSGLISNPAPGQLTAAIGNFNAVVEGASPAFLANPPAQFLAIQTVLAALSAAGQSH